MKQILIVGADKELSDRLSETIRSQGAYPISQAMTVRESLLLVAQQKFDLVLTPLAMESDVRRALQAIQPELELVAVASAGDDVKEPADGWGHTVISADDPGSGLQSIIHSWQAESTDSTRQEAVDMRVESGGEQTVVSPAVALETDGSDRAEVAAETTWPTHASLEKAVEDERISGALLMTGETVAAAGGRLNARQVQAIAERIRGTWDEECSALLQFVPSEDSPSQLLLFTTPVNGSRLLTVAALPDCNLKRLRRATAVAARVLAQDGEADPSAEPARTKVHIVDTNSFHSERPKSGSFALILTPRRPMPAALQAAVAKTLPEVASAAGCQLHYQQVEAHIVHLVTSCTKGQGSGWLAQVYKNGIEDRIQKQFGVEAHLWKRGFYAMESDRPLSDVELRLFSAQE